MADHQLERPGASRRKDILIVALAIVCSLGLAFTVGVGAVFWRELNQAKADRVALAEQVKQLGGTPVVEPKPGDRGPSGDRGPQGDRGPKGDPGPPGQRGPAGATPPCLMTSTKCQGATGIPGHDGADGTDGKDGEQGPAGADGQPGQDGAPGKDGADGRGITTGPSCVDDDTADGSHWVTTYTDGTTSMSPGPCRVKVVPPVQQPPG